MPTKRKQEIPMLLKGKWVGPGAEEMNGYNEIPDPVKRILQSAATAATREAAKARQKASQKASSEDERKFRRRLNGCGCIGCQFPSQYVFHERSAFETVLWDGKINGMATVVCDYLGHPKTAYVFPKKYKGRYALVPLKKSDYIFTARYVNQRRNKAIRYCVYRMVGEKDGMIMLQLINVCLNTVWAYTEGQLDGRIGKEWNGKLPPRFQDAFAAVAAHLKGSKLPFAKKEL